MKKRSLILVAGLVIIVYLYRKGYLDGVKDAAEKLIDNMGEACGSFVKSIVSK